MKGILGIDPGLEGGFCLYWEAANTLVEPMPRTEKGLDLPAIVKWIRAHKDDIELALLEQVSAMPGQGVSSMFKFGRVYGAIEGVLAALEIPYELVTPQRWQKVMHQGVEGGLDSKARSRVAASRLFPSVDLRASARCRIPHSGMQDALLIAAYGRRRMPTA